MNKKTTLKLRTTREHHAQLKQEAADEGVSLNQYLLYRLALALSDHSDDEDFADLFDPNVSAEEGSECR